MKRIGGIGEGDDRESSDGDEPEHLDVLSTIPINVLQQLGIKTTDPPLLSERSRANLPHLGDALYAVSFCLIRDSKSHLGTAQVPEKDRHQLSGICKHSQITSRLLFPFR